jgi:1,4-alpha-glucan branching enzyme
MAVDHTRVDKHSPMGANAGPGGTGFRTWAPHARAVWVVAGERLTARPGLNWVPDPSDALSPLGDGTWGGFVTGVDEGDPYMFFVEGEDRSGWKRDPYARELTFEPAFPGSFCIVRRLDTYRWRAPNWQPPIYPDLVLYQLHIGTWWAQDEFGNDERAVRGGTFLDAVAKLGHLRALGVNAVQLLPIQEFETHFSLGYNGVDFFSPEGGYAVTPSDLGWRVSAINAMLASFGLPATSVAELTPACNQLKCFIDLCHLHGIAVIFDVVYNHAGGNFDAQSLWFFDMQADGDPNRSLYFTNVPFAGGQVFAYWNQHVAQFLIDNAIFLLEEYRIDGLRYDEVRILENNGASLLCQNLTNTVRFVRPSAIQIAEYWNDDRPHAIRAPPSGLGFDSELGDGLRDSLRSLLGQLVGGESAPINFAVVASNLVTPPSYPNAWQLNQCLENQDKVYVQHSDAARVASLADPSNSRSWYARSRSRAVTALLLSAPGIPALFMGQEFLEDKKWSDDPKAGLLIWWEGLTAPDPSMRNFLRFFTDLIHLRHTQPALRSDRARVSRSQNFERVLVLHRWIEGTGDDVVIVACFDELPKHGYRIGLPFAGRWREVLNTDAYEFFPNTNTVGNGGVVFATDAPMDGFVASATISLPANGAIALVRH